MLKVLRVTKALVMLVVAAFIALVAWGVYTALDAAPAYTLATSRGAAEEAGAGGKAEGGMAARAALFSESPEIPDDAGNALGGVVRPAEEGTASPGTAPVQESTPVQPAPGASAPKTATPAAPSASKKGSGAGPGAGSSSSSSSGSSSNSNFNSNSNSGAPASSAPPKAYHPAWDEWVEEGHWENVSTPATYGEREVYGSVCSECGQDISGFAMGHLKDYRNA